MLSDLHQSHGSNQAANSQQEDVRRQALNVFRIKLLGARVVAVESGSRTLRDAVNEVGYRRCSPNN